MICFTTASAQSIALLFPRQQAVRFTNRTPILISDDAKAFIEEAGLSAEMDQTANLLHEHYPSADELKVDVQPDMDQPRTALCVTVVIDLTVEQATLARQAFTKSWTSAIPSTVRDQFCFAVFLR